MKQTKRTKLIYLACLYSLNADLRLLQARFERVEKVSAVLIRDGYNIFSPIVYNHAMAIKYEFPKTFGFWKQLDQTFISHCDELWILEGDVDWHLSVGVSYELQFALKRGIKVKIVSYDDKTDNYTIKSYKESK